VLLFSPSLLAVAIAIAPKPWSPLLLTVSYCCHTTGTIAAASVAIAAYGSTYVLAGGEEEN